MNRAWLHSWKLNLLSSGTLELKFLENACFTLLQVTYYSVRINLCILVHQGTLLPLWYLLAGSDFPRWIKPSRPHRQTDLYGFRIQVFKQCICDHRFLPCQNISVLRQVIRDDWWGSDKNDVTYSKWIRRFLQGEQNTYHSLNYHVLIFRLNLLKVWNYDIPFQNRYLLNKEKKCFRCSIFAMLNYCFLFFS